MTMSTLTQTSKLGKAVERVNTRLREAIALAKESGRNWLYLVEAEAVADALADALSAEPVLPPDAVYVTDTGHVWSVKTNPELSASPNATLYAPVEQTDEVGFNGLTEEETSNTMSVMGLQRTQQHGQSEEACSSIPMPDMTSKVVNDTCWELIRAMPHRLPGGVFNDLKPAVYEALKHYHTEVLIASALEPVDMAKLRRLNSEVKRLTSALSAATISLNTIAMRAGVDENMEDMCQVRGYARNRCHAARESLKGQQ